MAVKGYIGDSKVKYNSGRTRISNGEVSTAGNLRDHDYPSSIGVSTSGVAGVKTNPSSSGSYRSSRSGSSSSSNSNLANAYSALLAAYGRNDYSDYLNQMRAAAQSAYDRGMGALNDAYNNQMSSLRSNLNETKSQLLNQYNRSKQNVMDDANESLKQAYINKMLSQRNLSQQMAAQGLNGGATETTMAGMYNNYGNARNNINTTQNKNLSELEGNYSDNLSQAMQAYNSAVASANLQRAQQAMQLENALANNQISALGDYQTLMQRENQNYLDLLKTAIANGASFTYDPTQANNGFAAMAIQQAAAPTASTNNAAWQSLIDQYAKAAQNAGNLTGLTGGATQNNYLAQILKQLGA